MVIHPAIEMHALKAFALGVFMTTAMVSASPTPFDPYGMFVEPLDCRALDCDINVQALPYDNLDKIFSTAYNKTRDSNFASSDGTNKAKIIQDAVKGLVDQSSSSSQQDAIAKSLGTTYNAVKSVLELKERKIWLMNGFVYQAPPYTSIAGVPDITNAVRFKGRVRVDRAIHDVPAGSIVYLEDVGVEDGSSANAWIDNCNFRQNVKCARYPWS